MSSCSYVAKRFPVRRCLAIRFVGAFLICQPSVVCPANDVEAAAPAPVQSEAKAVELPIIQVKAPRLNRNLYETPAAVSVVNAPQIREGHQRLQLDESLATVPGLYFQNRYNFAQNQRISIRGFGARAPFGVRGIHLQVDGIPYTLPDGQSQVDAIDLDSAIRIEVLRGASSVQFGNAAGGAISVTTDRGDERPDGGEFRITGGSHEFGKASIRANVSSDSVSTSASLSWLDYKGFREQSQVRKALFNGRTTYSSPNGRSLTATLNLMDTPTAEDPGGLNAQEVQSDRSQANANSVALDAGQEVDQQTIGVHFDDATSLPGRLTVRGFYTHRDFQQQLPFAGASLIAYDRHFFGGGVQYQSEPVMLWNKPITLVSGAEVHRQEDSRSRYLVASDGAVGDQVQEDSQTGTSVGIFSELDLTLSDALNLSLGTRYDRLRLAIDDRLASDDDTSGSRTFEEVSATAGLSYQFGAFHQAYVTVGTAFESPTFTEFANPDGSAGFNPDIQPQDALNREIGLRGLLGTDIAYELSLFSTTVDNELVPYEVDGRTFYENAGETNREGVELAIDWTLSRRWSLTSALTLADYELESFRSNGEVFDGNELPGLPKTQWANELEWSGRDYYATLETQYISEVYADNANNTEVDAYWLLNWRGGIEIGLTTRHILEVFAGVRNITDEEYFSNLRVNASYGKYYEPAPGRTFHVGSALTF